MLTGCKPVNSLASLRGCSGPLSGKLAGNTSPLFTITPKQKLYFVVTKVSEYKTKIRSLLKNNHYRHHKAMASGRCSVKWCWVLRHTRAPAQFQFDVCEPRLWQMNTNTYDIIMWFLGKSPSEKRIYPSDCKTPVRCTVTRARNRRSETFPADRPGSRWTTLGSCAPCWLRIPRCTSRLGERIPRPQILVNTQWHQNSILL